jgi:ribonucleoside-triphosphate reductase
MENTAIPYITVTPTFSICNDHGYLSGEQFNCPICGNEAEVWTRVVGFHRPVQSWNKGKKEEYNDRKEFSVSVSLENKACSDLPALVKTEAKPEFKFDDSADLIAEEIIQECS